ncbi:OmpA family protein [Zeaxanthinibacter sp. PT1]|uniref:OmpA family protein n=1 Tax=Zeaxanthinibacter TaxID=561554 RepID=UPI00234B6D6B|nr:OmpA family protein [Zeaxanthinibacter sp. PT1]MDC6352803.1 OmpA family protein [Zeaxanthinibacter sp. PT1]
MKNQYTKILIVLLSFTLQLGMAQYGAQKRGDYFFGQFAYSKAIVEYEKMVEGGFNLDHAHQQLAECYLLIRDFKKALPHFEKIINNSSVPTDYYFKYAMALYSDGQYDESEKWLKKYKKYNKNDSRVKRFLKDGNLASVVFNSRQRYSVELADFNTEESDFGVFARNGYLYFASSSKEQVAGDEYGWNDEPWLDLFRIREDVPGAVPELVNGDVNTKYHESNLIFTTDYKKDTVIYFTRNNFYKNKKAYGIEKELNLKIYRAEKEDGEWKVNKSLPMNSDYYSTGHPYVSPDGRRIYYTSDRPGGFGGTDIYYSEIHERGGIGPPINAGPVVNTEGNEMFPFINNEDQLFFSSDGHVGYGQLDVFSTISDESGKIVDVINLGTPVNSGADDFGYYAHENGIFGYISSNREGGKGSDDIYKFKFTPSLTVEGYVHDGVNGKPLDSVRITIYDQKTGIKEGEVITDSNGFYSMFINRERNYMLEAVRRTHPHKSVYFNTYVTPITTRIMRQDIVLEPVLDLKLLANLKKIYFDFNKHDIRPDAAWELDKVVKLMTVTYPDMIIRLEAHTDPVGSYAYNDNLSERRAKSTYEYLIAHGVSPEQIVSYKGFGKREPINDCTGRADCTPDELELNRRTEFPIVQIKKGRQLLAKQ